MNFTTSTVRPQELHRMAQQGEPVHLVDVRTAAEYVDGHAEGFAGATARCGLAAFLTHMPWNRAQSGQPSSA